MSALAIDLLHTIRNIAKASGGFRLPSWGEEVVLVRCSQELREPLHVDMLEPSDDLSFGIDADIREMWPSGIEDFEETHDNVITTKIR